MLYTFSNLKKKEKQMRSIFCKFEKKLQKNGFNAFKAKERQKNMHWIFCKVKKAEQHGFDSFRAEVSVAQVATFWLPFGYTECSSCIL